MRREAASKQVIGGAIYAAGVGKPNPAMDAAQNRIETPRAATLDAVRWLAYFIYWRANNFKTIFGSMPDVSVPGFETVRMEFLDDGTCIAEVKIKL